MFAVSCSERVVNVYVGIACKSFRELFLARFHLFFGFLISGISFVDTYRLAFFLGIEAEIFKEENFTGLKIGSSFGSICAIGGEFHVATKGFGNVVLNLGERELGINLPFGFAHVAHDDEASAVVENFLKSGQSAADTGIVGDVAVFVKRHIEVNANDGFLAVEIVVVDCHRNMLV